jgi:CRP-like cAMP-binding protein
MKNNFIELIIKANKDKQIKSYKSNEIIFFEDQECEFASIILKGSIYMTSLYNDKEINFNYMKKGSIFGHNLLFNVNNKYKAHIVAVGNTQILHLNKQDF